MIKFIQFSNMVIFFTLRRGFGVFNVKGFSLLPNPAHRIKAVLIFIQFFSKILV